MLNFIFPQVCASCSALGDILCDNCRAKIETCKLICPVCKKRNPLGVTCPGCLNRNTPQSLIALYRYNGLAKDLITKFKFEDLTILSDFFAKEIIKRYNKRLCVFSLITCMPTTTMRRIQRGYNQSELLARQLSSKLEIPFKKTLTTRHSTPQSEIENEFERRKNIKGKIQARERLDGEKILLVDDIYTTGATIQEATKVLICSGASSVDAVVIAIAK